MTGWLQRNWFLCGLAVIIALAGLTPPLAGRLPTGSISKSCIFVIFVFTGLTLRSREILRNLGHWRLHGFVQGFNLLLIPAIFWSLDPLWALIGLDPALRSGLLVLSAVPTTIASCVALTVAAHGNQAGAVCSTTLGNLLGVVVTPLLILVLLGHASGIDYGATLASLSMLVLLPVVCGQILQLLVGIPSPSGRKRLVIVTQGLLLIILFIVFNKSLHQDSPLHGRDLFITLVIVAGLHGLILALCWWLAGRACLGFDRGDRIAALFTASQKTVAMGIPIITVVFADDPIAGLIALPLLMYHPIQLLFGGIVAGRLDRFEAPTTT